MGPSACRITPPKIWPSSARCQALESCRLAICGRRAKHRVIWHRAIAGRLICALINRPRKPTLRPGEVFRPGFIRTVREGSDVTLAATGGILGEVLLAADALAGTRRSCRVLSVHTVKPLDTDTLASPLQRRAESSASRNTPWMVGWAAPLRKRSWRLGISPGFFVRIGLRNTFSSVVGSQEYLRTVYSLDAASIVRTVSVKMGIAEEALSR